MDKDEIEKRLKNIVIQLESKDIQFQVTALDAFNDLILNENLTNKQKEVVIPFIEKNLKITDSSIKSDCIKTACFIGAQQFILIENIFQFLFDEIELKNRFRIEYLLNMFVDLRNSNHPKVKKSFEEIIKRSPEIFDEDYLINKLENFWESLLDKDYQFIANYLNILQNEIINYPDDFSNIKNLILEKIGSYNKYLEQIKIQKQKEIKLRDEYEKKAKVKMENDKKEKIERDLEMKEKLKNYVKSISEKELVNSNFITKEDEIDKKEDTSSPKKKKPESQKKDTNTNSDFTTFTKLGLKRKSLDDEN